MRLLKQQYEEMDMEQSYNSFLQHWFICFFSFSFIYVFWMHLLVLGTFSSIHHPLRALHCPYENEPPPHPQTNKQKKTNHCFSSFCNRRRYSDLAGLGKFHPVEIHVCQNHSWGAIKRGHIKLTQGIAPLLSEVSYRFWKLKLTGHCQLIRHFHTLFFKWAFCR